MAANGQNRWIVLLNRSPKGPLTEEEVKTLLNQGILRPNDIAFLVGPEGSEKTKSEWKLLWQFPEFNRRQTTTGEKNLGPGPTVPDRRQKLPPEEIQKKALADLPPDLMEITPEDLIPRSSAVALNPEPESITPLSDETVLREAPERHPLSFDMRWAYGASVIAVLGFLAMKLPSWTRKLVKPLPTLETDEREPAMGSTLDSAAPVREPSVPPKLAATPHFRPRIGVGHMENLAAPTAPPPVESPAADRGLRDASDEQQPADYGERAEEDGGSSENRPSEESSPSPTPVHRRVFHPHRSTGNASVDEEAGPSDRGPAGGEIQDSDVPPSSSLDEPSDSDRE